MVNRQECEEVTDLHNTCKIYCCDRAKWNEHFSTKFQDKLPTPKSTLTEEEKAWLTSHLPAFREAQKKSETARFYIHVIEQWFKKFPERDRLFPSVFSDSPLLTDVQQAELQAAIKSRRAVKNWFYWNTRGCKRNSLPAVGESIAKVFADRKKSKRARLPSLIQVYQTMYKAKIQEAYNTSNMTRDANPTKAIGQRLVICATLAADLFRAETDEVKANVSAYLDKLKSEKLESASDKENEGEEGEGESSHRKTPDEYQKALDEMPNVLSKVFQQIRRETGWAFFVGCAGPLPNAGGIVYQQDYYFGPKTDAGNDFQNSYPSFEDFESGYATPFAMFAHSVFNLIRMPRSQSPDLMQPIPTSPSAITPTESSSRKDALNDNHSDQMFTASSGIGHGSSHSGEDLDPSMAILGAGHVSDDDGEDHDLEYNGSGAPKGDELEYIDPTGPSSPISHAFARMDQSLFTPAPPFPSPTISGASALDTVIDPLLLGGFGQSSLPTLTLQVSAPEFTFEDAATPRLPVHAQNLPIAKSPLVNPYATLATDPKVFGCPPINAFSFGHANTSSPASLAPLGLTATPPTPAPAFLAATIAPPSDVHPPILAVATNGPPVAETLAAADYNISGATATGDLVSKIQDPPPRIRPRPIKKGRISVHPSVPSGTEGPTPDATIGKENIPPAQELTPAQKAARTRARRKAEAEAASTSTEKGDNAVLGTAEGAGEDGGCKRKSPEDGHTSRRSGRAIKKTKPFSPE
ncbi:uncharacterized protein LACBIDRAFT_330940 [Laccaria bicolor S238N-H82]|uniref:Predicted protein n=1 Tax=Laccaria bicolor (strain S238N-H82 / ATCC MYA-4686) TaxID=486041 RepID=B0DMR0_LACBS|nr:uncharacterized protein LACBIDRAFT_330940 [Laccaria bicolor S238N-H82]EDR04012.1 predicted protein [Laccaria bicolor S238N-H82]|eukprot:XP_001885267.1 predicted protein [Laccaria bicolor S238N-H82]